MTSRRAFMKQTGLAAANLMATKLPINAPAGVEDQRFQQLHQAISSHATFLKIPGLVAAVVEDGRVSFLHTEGYGDSFASLLIRIPQEKLTFILLTNSVQAAEPFFLGYGHVLNSVFAQAFFKHIVYRRTGQFVYNEFSSKPAVDQDALFYDELVSQAWMRYYAEQTYHTHQGEAITLMHYLAKHDPGRFRKLNVSLIHLLAKLADPGLEGPMESAIAAYAASGWFHADIHELIANWYVQHDNWQQASL